MTGGRKHRRHVTPDEAKLWRAVTRQFVPLAAQPPEAGDSQAADPSPLPNAPLTTRARANPKGISAEDAKKSKSDPGLSAFEPRRAKRLSTGRIAIDAKLDLHGLRQNEARTELLGFLLRAQSNGLKHVKVITGKGAASSSGHEIRPFDLFEDGPRGILREMVPRWLGEAVFRALVVSFTVAGQGHGGGGALYVQVRKKAGR